MRYEILKQITKLSIVSLLLFVLFALLTLLSDSVQVNKYYPFGYWRTVDKIENGKYYFQFFEGDSLVEIDKDEAFVYNLGDTIYVMPLDKKNTLFRTAPKSAILSIYPKIPQMPKKQ